MSFISQHKLIVALIVIVMLGVGWYTLSGNSAPAPTLTTTSVAGSSPADQNMVSTLLALRAVTLDATIFSDPAFMSLKDFSTQIVPEPVGRTNPFAPLSTSASASATSTQSAQLFAPRR
jgi:hypothetical protein